jgi:hypothetical protein
MAGDAAESAAESDQQVRFHGEVIKLRWEDCIALPSRVISFRASQG